MGILAVFIVLAMKRRGRDHNTYAKALIAALRSTCLDPTDWGLARIMGYIDAQDGCSEYLPLVKDNCFHIRDDIEPIRLQLESSWSLGWCGRSDRGNGRTRRLQ